MVGLHLRIHCNLASGAGSPVSAREAEEMHGKLLPESVKSRCVLVHSSCWASIPSPACSFKYSICC
jgi:hypothetical protein